LDILLSAERSWNIRIPGFANDEIRQSQSRRVNALPSYQSRVAIVREAIRKRRSTNT
jgi:transcription initiation factor TFIID subunit TAF12